MTTRNTGQRIPSGRHPRPAGKVDFTFMYAAHDAFSRDLRRLAAAAEAGRTADPAVRDRLGDLQEPAARPPHRRGQVALARAAGQGHPAG